HLEPALEIYQRLVELRPDDAQLRDRLRAIEGELHGRADTEIEAPAEALAPVLAQGLDEPVYEAPPAEVPSVTVSGPTIREFLAGLVTVALAPTDASSE